MRKFWRIDWCKMNNDGTYSVTNGLTYLSYESACLDLDVLTRIASKTEWFELVEVTEKVISL